MRSRWTLALAVAALLVSGCGTPGPGKGGGEAVDGLEHGPRLEGVVVDAAIRPLPGVLVRVLGMEASATTGEDGEYVLSGLPLDQILVVSAVLDSYTPSSKQATLSPDEPTRLDFVLEIIPSDAPYQEVVPFSGFLPCQTSVMAEDETQFVDCSNGVEVRDRFDARGTPGLVAAVFEVFWEANAPAANSLGARLELVEPGGAVRLMAETLGTSPLRIQVAKTTVDQMMPDGGTMRLIVRAEPNGDELEASVAAAAAFQQSFDAYASLFYVEGPDPTYSVANR